MGFDHNARRLNDLRQAAVMIIVAVAQQDEGQIFA
jgi:hypothetical protein